jgi:hypothetical protein
MRRYHHEVSSGVRMAVTMTGAATCTLAAESTMNPARVTDLRMCIDA